MSDQALQALAVANARRIDGAAIRAAVIRGDLTVAQALTDDRAGSLPIHRLLAAQPRWGINRTNSALRTLHISPYLRVRDLTDRQKQRVGLICAGHNIEGFC